MMGVMADSGGTRNEITGGLFFNAVVQARDIGSLTLQLPVTIPTALAGPPARSAAPYVTPRCPRASWSRSARCPG
jgi:hypothetical protein